MRIDGPLRYVALGDSQTEGLGDGDDVVGLRGWADRLAERLALTYPDVLYANLAIRGRRAAEVRAEQLAPALALRPHVATVVAGVNDLLRRRFDADEVAGHLAVMFEALTAQGARVATVTFPDVARIAPLARPIRARVPALNRRILQVAERHGIAVADAYPHAVVTDPRLWSADRLHATALGHERIAAAVAHALGLPGSDASWTLDLPEPHVVPARWRAAATELRWVAAFAGPWAVRRVRGRSSGDGRTAKRPDLLPLPPLTPRPQGRP
jgi:lysophospholipase L1-like esterase